MTTQQTAHTPTPWFVRRHQRDFFVAAPTPQGHPYFGRTDDVEIMSDEDYPTKLADAEFIILACNAHDALLAAAEAALKLLDARLFTSTEASQLRAAIRKAKEEQP